MSFIALKRMMLPVSLVLAVGGSELAFAAAADQGASVVVRLYKDYAWQAIGGQSDAFGEGLSHQSKLNLEKYFHPALASLLVKDANCQIKSQGICNLDFDPLFVSQDPIVVDLGIEQEGAGKVVVKFKNPISEVGTKLEFSVAYVAGRWRITDIIYRDKMTSSLTQILARKVP